MPLSREARIKKNEYNKKRNKELNKQFVTNLKKAEYQEIMEYLHSVGMNKAEFIRWAFDRLRNG